MPAPLSGGAVRAGGWIRHNHNTTRHHHQVAWAWRACAWLRPSVTMAGVEPATWGEMLRTHKVRVGAWPAAPLPLGIRTAAAAHRHTASAVARRMHTHPRHAPVPCRCRSHAMAPPGSATAVRALTHCCCHPLPAHVFVCVRAGQRYRTRPPLHPAPCTPAPCTRQNKRHVRGSRRTCV